ncbi:alpha/beta fold hydrolase [Pseudaestuariivita atlantica]|uniref:AB hydrolase-1 domain-containing protein n=1 Tax=Pseudaestuariivita atlantica TaxID=1317121 RepID=A0A0L1JLH0_9RHOB|nr:alpha/beta hydrolase [Pseudaestuariivita atlantica]KNG92595.1 hypothetical protein ATO11_16355 [Pseudaestuariivita atlantica]
MQLHWQRLGDAPRVAVAVHCSLAHGRSWSAVAQMMGGRLAVEACDMPGHGRSPGWSDAEGEIQGLTARAVIDRIEGLGGPVPLIGHSFGGTVALRVALDRPDLVSHLVLLEPVMFAAAFGVVPGARERYEATFAPFAAAIAAGDRMEATRVFTTLWGGGVPWEALPQAQREAMAARIHLVVAGNPGIVEDVGGILAPGRLEALDLPVLLMDGAASPPVIDDIQRALHARLPRARRLTVPGAGHMLPLTHARAVADGILALNEERAEV